jgi:tetratricopeptide (TPR) repeat protein
MVRSQAPVPEAIKHSIARGRFSEAAEALRVLVRQEPSAAILLALADMDFQLGNLTAAKENALRAGEASPRDQAARILLARVRAALDETDAALSDFRAALELAQPPSAPSGGAIAVPAHQALHNLEQLIYLEQADGLAPGTLLPAAASLREVAQSKLNQMLNGAGSEIPTIPLGGQYGRLLAAPPLVMHAEAPPAHCLNPRDDWNDVAQAFKGEGKGIACVDHLLTPEALAQLQRFCLRSTVWRRPYPPGYIGASPETGFFSPLLLQIAAELRHAIPELLDGHHLNYWWSSASISDREPTSMPTSRTSASISGSRRTRPTCSPAVVGWTFGTSRLLTTGPSTTTTVAAGTSAPSFGRRRHGRSRTPITRTGPCCSGARSSTRRQPCGSPRVSRIGGVT